MHTIVHQFMSDSGVCSLINTVDRIYINTNIHIYTNINIKIYKYKKSKIVEELDRKISK